MDRIDGLTRHQILKELQTLKYHSKTQKEIGDQFNTIGNLRDELRRTHKSTESKIIYLEGNPYTEEELIKMVNYYQTHVRNTSNLTGLDDADIYILEQLDDESLIKVCQTDKRINRLCKNKKLNTRIVNYLKAFNDMKYKIARAIAADTKRGSRPSSIKKYFSANYQIDLKDPFINNTINKLASLEKGERLIINPSHPRYYQLSPELKKALLRQDKY